MFKDDTFAIEHAKKEIRNQFAVRPPHGDAFQHELFVPPDVRKGSSMCASEAVLLKLRCRGCASEATCFQHHREAEKGWHWCSELLHGAQWLSMASRPCSKPGCVAGAVRTHSMVSV